MYFKNERVKNESVLSKFNMQLSVNVLNWIISTTAWLSKVHEQQHQITACYHNWEQFFAGMSHGTATWSLLSWVRHGEIVYYHAGSVLPSSTLKMNHPPHKRPFSASVPPYNHYSATPTVYIFLLSNWVMPVSRHGPCLYISHQNLFFL